MIGTQQTSLPVRPHVLFPVQGLTVTIRLMNPGSFSSTEGDPHHLGSPYYTELHDPQSAVNQMAATPETPPPSEPHPTANRRPVGRCSNCGQTGHRSESPAPYLTFSHSGNFQITEHAQRCPKYASDPLHHSKVAFCVEPKRDLIMSHPGGRRFKCQFTYPSTFDVLMILGIMKMALVVASKPENTTLSSSRLNRGEGDGLEATSPVVSYTSITHSERIDCQREMPYLHW